MAMAASSKQWTRVRTLGRGASGAEVFLAADDASGELFAVKSASAAAMGAAAALRREQGIMAGLRSPNVLSCIGGRGGRDGSYQLFLEFAPGGSLADGGRLEESAVRAYAADLATGLAYLHGAGLVHGDVKPRNVVIGGDGCAKLADFGCSRKADSCAPILGGTPAFMAPEVARGEEQGPAADIWALGCTVVEMATGRAPWNGTGMDDDGVLAALHRIGYTYAVPQVPQWLTAEAKDFLSRCLVRRPGDRCTAAQLLEHPFLSAAGKEAKREWVSPKSTLDAAFWETDADEEEEEEEVSAQSTAERIRALACPASSLPEDWDSDEGWIDVLVSASDDAAPMPTLIEATLDRSEESSAETSSLVLDATADSSDTTRGDVGEAAIVSIGQDRILPSLEISSVVLEVVSCKLLCDVNNSLNFVLAQRFRIPLLHCVTYNFSINRWKCSCLPRHKHNMVITC
ncbi:mitogen-activated protein kinase kinase kinase 17 [Brachypodium distachyon]|uniref:mitogen-activated protein kinase kinase kinase 17 n=1 Tax=Brachypodium distachyon TaxID=15368 RepID=UPI000D0DABC2|nr:mitogen-activated protein kinase kinase kinase 17 [Brachypodium distachyon]|eukprot:XP_024314523.1 mitogen-activated protein kinase kinase kinase 17 [Brachypodium distachyon]